AFGWLAAVIFCSFIYAAVLYPFIAFAAVDLEIRLAAGITYFAAWGFAAYLMLYFNVPAPATYGLNLCLLALPAAGYAVMADRFPVDANAISTFATSTALLVGVLFVVVVLEGLGNGSW